MKRHTPFSQRCLSQCGLLMAVLAVAACGRTESEPSPAPLQRDTSRDFEVLERVRQKRAPGEEITRIGQAVEQYQVRFGRLPENVATLVRTGFLPAQPEPPEGMVYVIDPMTGNVGLVREIDYRLRSSPRVPR